MAGPEAGLVKGNIAVALQGAEAGQVKELCERLAQEGVAANFIEEEKSMAATSPPRPVIEDDEGVQVW